jgi:subtilase family serine protease
MSRRVWIAACLLLALQADAAFAVQKPRSEDRVLPNFDVRATAPGPVATPPDVDAALRRFRRQAPPGLVVRMQRLTRVVRLLSARDAALTPPRAGSPLGIALEFLQANGDLFGLTGADVQALVARRAYASSGDRVAHVWFDQMVDGIAVHEGAIAIHVDGFGRVVLASSSAAAPARDRAAPAPRLSAEDAILAAAVNVRPELSFTPALVQGPRGPDRATLFARGPFRRDIPVRLVLFPERVGLTLTWQVRLEPEGFPQAYEILVDAATGAILYRTNLVRYADGSGRILQSAATVAIDLRLPDPFPIGTTPSGLGDPSGGCPPVDNYFLRGLTAQFRDPSTVLSNTGSLSGNDTQVFRRSSGSSGAAGTPIDGVWHFDFPFNSAGSAETFLFFAANFLHDFFYDLGFDEAAGAFQLDNFGRGGIAGDPLSAVARAAGRNNATFAPAPEGESPTMSMFLWDGQGCWAQDVDGDGAADLDSDYDLDIIIHEYHHGVSHRLNTAFTGPEADAIGEGGSDFFAYSITGDTYLAEYSAPPQGIRAVNGKTYADWFCLLGIFCEEHANGEIWANVLWELRERFRRDLVGGSDLAGVGEIHRLYVDGLKLSPPQPTMLDLRDAMLQADALRNPSSDPGGSANYCRLWDEFARRGMGVEARDTQDTGNNTVGADLSVPGVCPAPLPPPSVTIEATTPAAAEAGQTAGIFTVRRTGDTTRDLTVRYSVSGTATPGSDYTALAGSVTMRTGEAAATIVVAPIDDALVDQDETVIVTLTSAVTYRIETPGSATVTIASDDVAPDLVVSTVTTAETAGAGSSITVTDTTANTGNAAAAGSTTRFYLSSDAVVGPADVLFDTARSVPLVDAGGSSTGSTVLTIPASTATGVYYVIARADSDDVITEIHETNNTKYAYVQIGPDLVVSVLTAPTMIAPGSTVVVSDTTLNRGGGAAGASTTRVYLSSDPLLDAADTALGSGRPVSGLAPGASSATTTSVAIPPDLTAGAYYLIARADDAAQVAETLETNNTKYAYVQVGADLILSAFTAPSSAAAGATISVTDTTVNQGAAAAGASTTRVYLSTNAVWDAGDLLLDGGRPVPALAPASSSSGSTALVMPAGTNPGAYYLIARADADAVLPEAQEGNNTRLAPTQVGPDLVVSALSAPAVAGPGASIAVSDSVNNKGRGAVSSSTVRFYLSSNWTVDSGDVVLGSRVVSGLGTGETSSGSTAVTIPASTSPGAYFLIGLADADQMVAEAQEGNNTSSVSLQVGTDLVVATLTAPTAAGAGGTIVVSDTTKNQGSTTADPSTTRFYLSTNFTLDGSDVAIGSRAVPTLVAGASNSASTTLAIPAGTAVGAYNLIARADADEAVIETQEGNNTKVASLQIGPDLVVLTVTPPGVAAAGSTMSVSVTTRNQGGGPAGSSNTRFYLSTNFVLDAADVLLSGEGAAPALAAGASHTGTASVTIPSSTSTGAYYLIARADGGDAVTETQEGNNTRFAYLQVGTDLIVSTLSAPTKGGAGSSLTVTDTTKNQGGGPADASTTRFYLSANYLLDATDVLLSGGRVVPALAVGASSTGATMVTIPASTATGTYYLIAMADADKAVIETQETNNTKYVSVQVGPDLTMTALTAPTPAAGGASIVVNDTVKNQGGGAANPSTVRFYLSTNFTLDATDTLLNGSRSIAGLAPGQESVSSTMLTIPASTAPGDYYVLAAADGDAIIPETQEGNNTRFAFLRVTAPPTP